MSIFVSQKAMTTRYELQPLLVTGLSGKSKKMLCTLVNKYATLNSAPLRLCGHLLISCSPFPTIDQVTKTSATILSHVRDSKGGQVDSNPAGKPCP